MVYYNETIFGKVHRVSRKIGGNPFKRSQKNFGIFEKIITWRALLGHRYVFWAMVACEVGDGVNGTFWQWNAIYGEIGEYFYFRIVSNFLQTLLCGNFKQNREMGVSFFWRIIIFLVHGLSLFSESEDNMTKHHPHLIS